MDFPKVNWFGGMLITRSLLEWSKSGVEDESSPESLVSKMNRVNLFQRVMLVTTAINTFGPTLDAANAIQADGKGFFTDVSAEGLAGKMAEGVEKLKGNGIWKIRAAEFGTLEFDSVKASD